jgi:Protein of unknown function (DUF3579)
VLKPVKNWIILGIDLNEKTFRPSDWAARICELASNIRNSGMVQYSDDLRPIRYNGQTAVYVDIDLKLDRTKIWEQVMSFANLHQLKVIEYADPVTAFHSILKPKSVVYLQDQLEDQFVPALMAA